MIAVAAGGLCAMFVVILVLVRSAQAAEARWASERRELLNRIQRPEYIPRDTSQVYEIPERDPDEWAKVGTVDIADDYGLDDE